jgi:uncharacterized protein
VGALGRVLLVGTLAAVLLVTALWALQRRLIYLPDRGPVPPAAAVLPGARDVRLETSDGLALGAYLVPPAGPDRRTAVLVAPGNAGNRAGRAPLARALAAEGLTVLLVDYRGYGGNPGSPSEEGLARDVRAARRYLLEEAGTDPGRLLYYGESLGAAVVAELATEHPPAGLLLRSPFLDLAAVARVHYPFLPARALLRDRFPVGERVRALDVAITVVYGTDDTIVPAEQSRAVAAGGAEVRRVEVAGADHNDSVLLDGTELVQAVVDLADAAVGPP